MIRNGGVVPQLERALGFRTRARWIPVAWVTLFFASNFRFSGFRDPSLASSGLASPENLVEISVYGAVGLLAFGRWLGQRQKLRSAGIWGLGVFGVLAVSSALWSRVTLFSLVRGAQVVAVGLLAVVSSAVWASRERDLQADWHRIWLWFLVLAGVATLAGISLGSYIDGRFTWVGQHPGVTGILLGVAALVVLSMMLERGWSLDRRLRSLLPVLLLTSIVFMALTITRTALVGLLLSALVLFLSSTRTRFGLRAIVVSGLVLVTIALLMFLGDPIFLFVSRGAPIDQLLTLTGRTELWLFALDAMRHAPVIGYGYGAGRLVLYEAIPWAGTGHNLWVESAVSLGLIGVFLVTGLFVWMAFTASRQQRRVPGPISHLALGLVSFEIIEAITGPAFAVPSTGLTLAALLIAALSARRWLNVDDCRRFERQFGKVR